MELFWFFPTLGDGRYLGTSLGASQARPLRSPGFFDEFRLQAHRAEAVDLAIDRVVTLHQANVFDLGSHF